MIRKATLRDLNKVYELIKIGSEDGQVLLRSKNELTEVIGCFYVAIEKGQIVGCCILEEYSPKLAEIRSLVVQKNFRSKGIGTDLVKECIKDAKKTDIYEVLSITDKVNFFEKFGFRNSLNNQVPLFLKLRDRYNGDNK